MPGETGLSINVLHVFGHLGIWHISGGGGALIAEEEIRDTRLFFFIFLWSVEGTFIEK